MHRFRGHGWSFTCHTDLVVKFQSFQINKRDVPDEPKLYHQITKQVEAMQITTLNLILFAGHQFAEIKIIYQLE